MKIRTQAQLKKFSLRFYLLLELFFVCLIFSERSTNTEKNFQIQKNALLSFPLSHNQFLKLQNDTHTHANTNNVIRNKDGRSEDDKKENHSNEQKKKINFGRMMMKKKKKDQIEIIAKYMCVTQEDTRKTLLDTHKGFIYSKE